jgi:hypothetical protein
MIHIKLNNTKKIENMTDVDKEEIKKLIYETYKIDVQAIKNLSTIAVAGDMKASNNITSKIIETCYVKVIGDITIDSNIKIIKDLNVNGNIKNNLNVGGDIIYKNIILETTQSGVILLI